MAGFKDFVKSVSDGFSQMLFPQGITCFSCGGELCGNEQNNLCAKCPVVYNKNFCTRCGRAIGNMAQYCQQCFAHGTYHFEYARSAVEFNETAKRLIHWFKYGGAKYLNSFLAEFMNETLNTCFEPPDILTFVPLHKKRLRKRGYNQAELLANALSVSTAIQVLPLLQKTAHTKNLAKLDRKGRAAAIQDTFSFCGEKSLIKNKSVLLIDDVLTTSATTDECARVLKAAGAQQVTVLTFASVQYKAKIN
ncbi:MAG: ComF family protein [Firmicutes bacterium]|nr:ComF family protein [Bacillota bacterium]